MELVCKKSLDKYNRTFVKGQKYPYSIWFDNVRYSISPKKEYYHIISYSPDFGINFCLIRCENYNYLWDYFETITETRKRKLKKLKIC
jgi:hypothetical protein